MENALMNAGKTPLLYMEPNNKKHETKITIMSIGINIKLDI